MWDGKIPERRYAMVDGRMVLVTGEDIETADQWLGFECWVGGVRQAEVRGVEAKRRRRQG